MQVVLRGLSAGIILMLATACGSNDLTTATRAPSKQVRSPASSNAATLAAFHRRIANDEVGRLHNALLDRSMKRLLAEPFVTGRICAQIIKAFEMPKFNDPIWAGRRPRDARLAQQMWVAELAKIPGCEKSTAALRSRVAARAPWRAQLTAMTLTDDSLSPAAHAIVGAMDGIRQTPNTAAGYAAAFAPYLDAAENQLSEPGDIETIQNLASIVVSSAEYWEAYLESNWSTFQANVRAACAHAVSEDCLGDGPIYETSWPGPRSATPPSIGEARLIRASYSAMEEDCDTKYDGWTVLGRTVGADALGAYGRSWLLGLRVVLAATAWEYAAAASATMFVGQGLAYAGCVIRET